MKKINWGIIGLGNIANQFAEGFSNLDNAFIKGIASKNEKKLISFKNKFNIVDNFCFNKYEELISNPDIDIIYIALPNSLHAHYIYEAIKYKKNVLVEKPAFTNKKDFKTFKDLLLDGKLFFTEGFMYRYLPYFQKLNEIIHNKSLGNIISLESNFNVKIYKQMKFFGINFKKPDFSNRFFNKNLGGGAILDLGCYPLSLSTFINSITWNVKIDKIELQKIDKSYCDSGVEIYSSAELNFDNNFIAKITCSFKDKLNQNTKINFDHGSINIGETWVPNKNKAIELNDMNGKTKINFNNKDNIYSYQIRSISDQLLNNIENPIFPSMTMEEIEVNTNIIEKWVEY